MSLPEGARDWPLRRKRSITRHDLSWAVGALLTLWQGAGVYLIGEKPMPEILTPALFLMGYGELGRRKSGGSSE